MIEKKQNRILDEFDRLYPDAKCELHYTTPLELLIAVLLSAQTTDASVNKVTPELFKKYHSASDYRDANQEDIEQLIRRIGLYRNKARSIKKMAAMLCEKYDGEVPQSINELIILPGVGRKTASVVVGEAFHVPSVPVDTHVERVSKRLGFAKNEDSVLTVEKKLKRTLPRERWNKLHHQFIFFGRYFCKAQSPRCKECQLVDLCKEKNKKL